MQKYDLVREEQNNFKYFFFRTEIIVRAKENLLSFGRVVIEEDKVNVSILETKVSKITIFSIRTKKTGVFLAK